MSGSWTVPTYFMCPNIEGFSTYEVVNAGVDLMENNASCKATCIDTVLVNTERVPEGYMNPEIYDEYLVQVEHDFQGLRDEGCRVISTDFLKLVDGGVFHDGDKVVDELFTIVFDMKY